MHACPDATLFAALIASRPNPTRLRDVEPPEPDVADLVLRLAKAARRTTSALREASVCLAADRDGPHLPALLIRAEAAAMEQAECMAALILCLTPQTVAA